MYKSVLLAVATLCCTVLNAQFFVKTQILSAQNNHPIPAVFVVEVNTNNATYSTASGRCDMQVQSDSALLSFSAVGYQELVIRSGSVTSQLILKKDTTDLNEIVITVLGEVQKKQTTGYASQSLKSEEVNKVTATNFVDNLAGKVAGLTVSQGATGVGSSSKITLRGESSFSNNNPLFVVDGIPINNNTNFNNTNEAAAGFQEVDFGNGAMEIDPHNVENVTALKGPTATALYGARAANGAIVITTKNGSNNGKVNIEVSSAVFIETAFKLPEFQNKYGQGNSGEFEFSNGLGAGTNDNITYSWGPRFSDGLLISQFDSPVLLPNGDVVRGGDIALLGGASITPTEFVAHPNNLRDFYQTGATLINNASVSGGFSKGNYRLSFTDLDATSIIPGVNYDRRNVSAKLNFDPSKKLKIFSSLNYINAASDNRPAGGYGSENTNYSLVAWGPRSLNINSLRDYWQPGLAGVQQFSYNYTFFDNPFFILNENRNAFSRDRAFGNIGVKYKVLPNLFVQIRSAMDYSTELRTFQRAFSSNRFAQGAYAEQDVFYKETNTDVLINYLKTYNAFKFDVSLGANKLDVFTGNKQTQILSLAQPGVYNLTNGASPLQVFQTDAQKRINSVYALAKVGYKNLLFLDVTGRNDWSSALAAANGNNTSFFYPSAALSYLVSNHFKLPKYISSLQLRGSIAQVGNDTDPYQTSNAYAASIPYATQPTFTASNTIANENILPELTTAYETGFKLALLDNRLSFDVTYFNANVTNQIIALPVPISSGYNQQIVNGGEINTQGFEAVVGIDVVRKGLLKYNIGFNFSTYKSHINNLPNGVDKITLAYSRIYDNENQTVWFQAEEGGLIGDFYGTGYLKNNNGDFVIDANGRYVADNTLKKLGNYNPDFVLAWNNEVQYKNFTFNILFDWHQGGEMVSRTLALGAVGGQLIETENRPDAGIVATGVVNVGTEANPVWEKNTTAVSAESYYRQYYDRNHEEHNVYDASYLKIRQFSLSYRYKPKMTKGLLAVGRTIDFSVIGRNLWAWSKIPHFDPEQLAVQGNSFVSGVEDMSYASTRSFGFKITYKY